MMPAKQIVEPRAPSARIAASAAAAAAAPASAMNEAPEGNDSASERADFEAMISGGMDVAVRNYRDPNCDYYIVRLADEPWHIVPAGHTLVSHEIWDADLNKPEFPPGSRVLHGYLWSRRDTRRRHYELWDPAFVAANARRQNTEQAWEGFPSVYFTPSMLLQVGIHLQPVVASARGGGRVGTWAQLALEDRDAITDAASG